MNLGAGMETVLIIGEDSPGALYHSYRRGFESLGMTVTGYCPVRARDRSSKLGKSRVVRRILETPLARQSNEKIADELSGARADLVLVLKGEQLAPDTIRHIRCVTGSPVVNFYPDDPFSKLRSNRLLFGAEVLTAYDICFTFARHLLTRYRQAGVRRIGYLPFARDPELHSPVEGVEEPEHEIVFVGNLDAERVQWLEHVADRDMVVYGEHTRKALRRGSPLRNATFRPGVYGPGFARAIRQGVLALNIMRKQNVGSHNMRSFESPGCAAFTLSQRTPELVSLFAEDEEIVCFGSAEEMRVKVARWLAASPDERRSVAEAGFRRVEHDTYARRAETVVNAIAEINSSQRSGR
jgi:hypothetical protein